jgi:hypothetical protein
VLLCQTGYSCMALVYEGERNACAVIRWMGGRGIVQSIDAV